MSILCFDQRFAQRGEQPGEGNRATVLGPRLAVHADEELSGRERSAEQENSEVFVTAIILDRNSQVCFHNGMVEEGFTKASRARDRAWYAAQ